MPFDSTDFPQPRVLTKAERRALAALKNARALLSDKRNWWSKSRHPEVGFFKVLWSVIYRDNRRQYCALTALSPWVNSDFAYDRLLDALPKPWHDIPRYNDDPSTTHADILALYDRAIAKLENE